MHTIIADEGYEPAWMGALSKIAADDSMHTSPPDYSLIATSDSADTSFQMTSSIIDILTAHETHRVFSECVQTESQTQIDETSFFDYMNAVIQK